MLIIFLLALSIRLVSALFIQQVPITSDDLHYNVIAKNILEGKGFSYDSINPTAARGPVYPSFLASVYFTFGFNYTAAKIIQAIIGAVACLFIYLIAKNIYNPAIGFCAALIASIYPSLVGYSSLLYAESLAAFLLSLSLLLFVGALRKNKAWLFAITGVSLGLLSLCYPKFLLLPIPFLFSFYWLNRSKESWLKYYLILLAGVFLIVAPWTLRNFREFRKLIPVSTGVGTTLWYSTLSDDYTEWHFDRKMFSSEVKGEEFIFSLKTNEAYMTKAVSNIKSNPLLFARLSLKRFFRQWLGSNGNSFYPLRGRISEYFSNENYALFLVKVLLLLAQAYVVVFALFGILADFNSSKKNLFSPVFLSIIYSSFINSVFMTSPRYQVPVLGLLFIYTVLGSNAVFTKLFKTEIIK